MMCVTRIALLTACALCTWPVSNRAHARPNTARERDADAAAEAAAVTPAEAPKRKVAVAYFEAAEELAAVRVSVLDRLSQQDDIEVVSPADIAMLAKPLGLDPSTPEARARLSAELGLVAWLDGHVTDDEARLTLTAPDGKVIAHAEVATTAKAAAEASAQLAKLGSERMWATMGPFLSDREARRVLLQIESQRALKKLEARSAEVERQKRVASAHLWPERATSRPVQGWNTPGGRAPVGPSGVSTATQRWLEHQAPPAQNAARPAPALPPAPPVGNDAAVSGTTPATQRWLAQQQSQ